jgi:hypothetical protein
LANPVAEADLVRIWILSDNLFLLQTEILIYLPQMDNA